MDMNTKYKLLEYCEYLGGIFQVYKHHLKMDIQDPNLKIQFFEFLEELLHDGSITLCDYRENPAKILTGTPQEQVNELRKIWPTMEEMLVYFPNDPWFYVEHFWWGATCHIELESLPKIEIYKISM